MYLRDLRSTRVRQHRARRVERDNVQWVGSSDVVSAGLLVFGGDEEREKGERRKWGASGLSIYYLVDLVVFGFGFGQSSGLDREGGE